MNAMLQRVCVGNSLNLMLSCYLLLLGYPAFAAQEVIFEPGGSSPEPLSQSLSWRMGGGQRVYFYFDTPAILQTTTNLSSGQWENIARESPYQLHIHDGMPEVSFRVIAAERPVSILVPDGYDPKVPTPLLISLHGYGSHAELQAQYMYFLPLAESHGFLYCVPEGIPDRNGGRIWNASASCWDPKGAGVDDAQYLRVLVQTARELLNVDSKRIYFVGISSGAFMAQRMAREHSDLVAAAACLAGTMSTQDMFAPSQPVNILQIHGTADPVMLYGGGSVAGLAPYLGAEATIERWAAANGCQDKIADPTPSLDLVRELPGVDTSITRFDQCPPGGAVELWTLHGGSHVPDFPNMSGVLLEAIIQWLLVHPKP